MSNKLSQYDVTIIGAGPAGSVLAYELARKGVKVLLLEKAKLPRKKVCAGGVTVRANSILPFDVRTSGIVQNVIYGARLSYNTQYERERTYDKALTFTVTREKFDHLLVSHACQAGVALEENVRVKHIDMSKDKVLVETDSESFFTPVLVGADGSNSIVVQSLNLRQGFEWGLALNGHVVVNKNTGDRWQNVIGLDMGVPGGYAWIFPKGEYLAIGAGGSNRVARGLRPFLSRLMRANNIESDNGFNLQGHPMPLRKTHTPISFARVLLIGDAAGLIDPLSGEGIYYAVYSAHRAAPAIMDLLEGKSSDLSSYQNAIDQELMPEFKIARSVQKINSVAPRIFFQCLRDNDRFWRAFCRMLRGEKNYTGLKKSIPRPLHLLFHIF